MAVTLSSFSAHGSDRIRKPPKRQLVHPSNWQTPVNRRYNSVEPESRQTGVFDTRRDKRLFVFYDTETTGTNTVFDQVLQFAAILTNDQLEEVERFEMTPHPVEYDMYFSV